MRTSMRRIVPTLAILLVLSIVGASNIHASPDAVQLYVNVEDTVMKRDADSVVVSVYMETFSDSVGGFELWFFIGQDEVLRFRSDSVWTCDTVYTGCTDSTCTAYIEDSCIAWEYIPSSCADTTETCDWVMLGASILDGSLIENWDYVSTNVLDANRRQLKIVGIANESPGPPKAIPPNASNNLLLRIVAEVREDKLDSLECADSTCLEWDGPDCLYWHRYNCEIALVPDSLCPDSVAQQWGITPILIWDNSTRFSNPRDELIGWHWQYACIDSECILWEDTVCIGWECTAWDYEDSSYVVDTTKIKYFDGQVNLNCATCDYNVGNADASIDVDIDDVVYLIAYIFVGGPAPVPEYGAGNADCNGEIDIDDVVFLIAYIFVGGPAPCDCEDLPPAPF
ncbi:MAG: hypothetical protein KKG33_14970 [candidate division Zixibacteria bacterium]|nr:hypothetical protein [candidate division Zixibacteria bacterium]MBU1469648.1 hypothetical protein [candidate division Zixibacteria bacterium]MBU2626853.1 hypothetical protein [candidate division Zixibacteria bacterium]